MTFRQLLDESVIKLVRLHNLAMEGLTEEQMVSVIKQAILAGDFQRLVEPTSGQQVVYIPFAREQQLVNQVRELEERIRELECKKQ